MANDFLIRFKFSKMLRQLITLTVLISMAVSGYAKEGMWIPTLLQKYNIEEMSEMGFKLSAEDVYSVNHASMKDAVILFGTGCTGGIISADGLLITNHHCGFSMIQKHSSVEHDYLTNGFWAMNRSEELINPGLTVQFLVKMEDITSKMIKKVAGQPDGIAIPDTTQQNLERIKKEFITGTGYSADIKPLFNGNQYFIYIYEVFKDVRLVGAPPVSIGKFGGDTDNWVWPRHTGDFSLFRIYAGKDNKPAPYSPKNVPYQPKKFFPINLKGLKEGDFTMVFGYPGTTQRYIPSQAVNLIMNQSDPAKVAIRTVKLDIWANQMKSDPKIRIQYASKYVSASNAWKKWQGEVKGLNRLDALNIKKRGEAEFGKWVASDPVRTQKYGSVLADFDRLYTEFQPYQLANDYYTECIQRSSDIFTLAAKFEPLESIKDKEKLAAEVKKLREYLNSYFKDYDQATDQQVWSSLVRTYVTTVDPKFLPEKLIKMAPDLKTDRFLAKTYKSSLFIDNQKINKLLDNFSEKSIKLMQKDQLYNLFKMIRQHYMMTVEQNFKTLNTNIGVVQKKYTAALLEMNAGKRLMADANLTLRIAYGKIEGYKPADGVNYGCFTTLKGIIEKNNPEIVDYNVPETLQKLYQSKDFGPYVNEKGEVPVAFCASNHTTGGNSGSPVVNDRGELIGLNFDRAWEGTMSDILYDPDECRNIALDMRYALFIIDKFAGAGYLLKEMELVK
jgi:hypothetical protein